LASPQRTVFITCREKRSATKLPDATYLEKNRKLPSTKKETPGDPRGENKNLNQRRGKEESKQCDSKNEEKKKGTTEEKAHQSPGKKGILRRKEGGKKTLLTL